MRRSLAELERRQWASLIALGLVMYTVTQGAQFLALERLPAQTTSLILSFSPVVVAFLGMAPLAYAVFYQMFCYRPSEEKYPYATV